MKHQWNPRKTKTTIILFSVVQYYGLKNWTHYPGKIFGVTNEEAYDSLQSGSVYSGESRDLLEPRWDILLLRNSRVFPRYRSWVFLNVSSTSTVNRFSEFTYRTFSVQRHTFFEQSLYKTARGWTEWGYIISQRREFDFVVSFYPYDVCKKLDNNSEFKSTSTNLMLSYFFLFLGSLPNVRSQSQSSVCYL